MAIENRYSGTVRNCAPFRSVLTIARVAMHIGRTATATFEAAAVFRQVLFPGHLL
ncbi:MAG TPA: hypothetical protein VH397_17880 [Xanthobacteraceae bacterium]